MEGSWRVAGLVVPGVGQVAGLEDLAGGRERHWAKGVMIGPVSVALLLPRYCCWPAVGRWKGESWEAGKVEVGKRGEVGLSAQCIRALGLAEQTDDAVQDFAALCRRSPISQYDCPSNGGRERSTGKAGYLHWDRSDQIPRY